MDYSITDAAAQVLDFLNPFIAWFTKYQSTNFSLVILTVITAFCFILGGVIWWFFVTYPIENVVDTSIDGRGDTFTNRQIDIKTKEILGKSKV